MERREVRKLVREELGKKDRKKGKKDRKKDKKKRSVFEQAKIERKLKFKETIL